MYQSSLIFQHYSPSTSDKNVFSFLSTYALDPILTLFSKVLSQIFTFYLPLLWLQQALVSPIIKTKVPFDPAAFLGPYICLQSLAVLLILLFSVLACWFLPLLVTFSFELITTLPSFLISDIFSLQNPRDPESWHSTQRPLADHELDADTGTNTCSRSQTKLVAELGLRLRLLHS